METARISLVVVHHDTKTIRALRGASNPDGGLVVAAVPPDLTRIYEVTWELLFGLGKLKDVTGAGRDADLNWELLAAWFMAHPIRDVVMVDAQWLGARLLGGLIGLATVSGVHLWLVAQQPVEDSFVAAIECWPVTSRGYEELAALVAGSGQHPNQSEDGPAFPPVPEDNYPTFRAQARRCLPAAAFDVVDARYRSSFGAAGEAIDRLVAVGQMDEEHLLGHIRAELHTCGSIEEMLTTLRATQAAAHRRGWLVSCDLPRLVVTGEAVARAAAHSPTTWHRLRAYREPYRGAACAFAALDASVEAMQGAVLRDVAPDGTELSLVRQGSREVVSVPVGAEIYLRAQSIHRRNQGAASSDLLFADDDGPMTAKRLANAVRSPLTDVGVPLISQTVQWTDTSSTRWATRWGLSVQQL